MSCVSYTYVASSGLGLHWQAVLSQVQPLNTNTNITGDTVEYIMKDHGTTTEDECDTYIASAHRILSTCLL